MGRINQTERMRRWGRGGERDIAICGVTYSSFQLLKNVLTVVSYANIS